MAEHKFLQSMVVKPNSDNLATYLLQVPKLVVPADESTFTIYYNGQIIQRYIDLTTSGPTISFAKFYYTLDNHNSSYISDPTSVGIESFCNVNITLVANQDFVTDGYTNTTDGIPVGTFDSTDIFYVSFYYTIVGAS